jgi:hypothetical protein
MNNIVYEYDAVTDTYKVTTASGSFIDITIPYTYTDSTHGTKQVTRIEPEAFRTVIATGTLTLNNITTIGEYAFNSRQLIGIDGPYVIFIDKFAFEGCSSLTAISLPSVTILEEGVFITCSSLTTISLPLVTILGDGVFNGCTSLTTISFPLVTILGDVAFFGCTSLTTISFPLVTILGNNVFGDCTSLNEIDLSGVITIGEYAFQNCTGFTDQLLVLPATLTTIGNYAFQNCSIHSYDFTACSDITIDSSIFIQVPPIDIYVYITPTQIITGPPYSYIHFNFIRNGLTYRFDTDHYVVTGLITNILNLEIPNTLDAIPITGIDDNAFYQKPFTLSGTLTFPTTLTSIGKSAFRGCGLSGMLVLPPNLTILEEYVFAECSFTSMAPPTQLTHIGARAFYNLPLFVYDFTQCESLSFIDPSAFDEYNQSFLDINVYVTQYTYDRLRFAEFPRYVKFHTGVPVSNICFVAGTLVQIDQGTFPIETLTRKHTLNGQSITLTKTKHDDPYLVKIQAYAFTNTPTQDTYMSMNHRIYFNHDRVKARDLVNGTTVTLVDYHGEPLYNVLVKAHTSMLVHGMRVETLDPTSPIALVYTSRLPPRQRIQIIQKLNTQEHYEETVMYLKRIQ